MSDWRTKLTQEEQEKFEEWLTTYDAMNAFETWMDEDRVHKAGNPFYGRSWDEHVSACKKSGRDPYD